MVDLKAETLFVWGRQDPHVSYAGREAIRARLEEVGALYEWHEVNAQHAFLRDKVSAMTPRFSSKLWRWPLHYSAGHSRDGDAEELSRGSTSEDQ